MSSTVVHPARNQRSRPSRSAAQTAEELVAKNIAAKGGIDKIKAIKSLRTSGKFQQGGITAPWEKSPKLPTCFGIVSACRE